MNFIISAQLYNQLFNINIGYWNFGNNQSVNLLFSESAHAALKHNKKDIASSVDFHARIESYKA